ncbi:YaaC family protein [Bacillus sp. Bva_UNVM-123]|uniref:YaaC family protein n=1 Tax=Bacillus sp. Bva_UNVM-123 TaxID=2829798 RepID=UPI00391FB66F
MDASHIWNSFLPFFSASSTQTFLKNCYHRQGIQDSELKSYENSYPFIYYLEHGQIYYQQAKHAPLTIQPILLFYGFVHLIKACILIMDPNYPETTSVLAHGVSTRKRKKQHYLFFQDEVKFQKSGLFPFMAYKLFHMKHLEGEKTTMMELLAQIPELNELFILTEGKQTFIKINQHETSFSLSKTILDSYHMTEQRFIDYWKSITHPNIHFQEMNNDDIRFHLTYSNSEELLPIKYSIYDQNLYFPLEKNNLTLYPELLIHYLLLYNLSMIARYETEWWSELIKLMPNQDYPFIQSFLTITAEKGPFLINQFLANNNKRRGI